MTATDELRRLLDERGVEWMPSVWSARDETFYKVGNTGFLATEMSSGRMRVCIEGYVTPEQAVEATLGSEAEIENTWLKEAYDYWRGMFEAEAAENAKLRKLVDYMTPIAWYAASENERDRMYELGVEV